MSHQMSSGLSTGSQRTRPLESRREDRTCPDCCFRSPASMTSSSILRSLGGGYMLYAHLRSSPIQQKAKRIISIRFQEQILTCMRRIQSFVIPPSYYTFQTSPGVVRVRGMICSDDVAVQKSRLENDFCCIHDLHHHQVFAHD